jgi:hypothetical protein
MSTLILVIASVKVRSSGRRSAGMTPVLKAENSPAIRPVARTAAARVGCCQNRKLIAVYSDR